MVVVWPNWNENPPAAGAPAGVVEVVEGPKLKVEGFDAGVDVPFVAGAALLGPKLNSGLGASAGFDEPESLEVGAATGFAPKTLVLDPKADATVFGEDGDADVVLNFDGSINLLEPLKALPLVPLDAPKMDGVFPKAVPKADFATSFFSPFVCAPKADVVVEPPLPNAPVPDPNTEVGAEAPLPKTDLALSPLKVAGV